MSKKIIKFPEMKGEAGFPASIQESIDHLESVRKSYCDEISADVFDSALTVVHNYGLRIKSDDIFIKDAVFLEEAIKAFVYRFKRLDHPMHEVIDNIITISDEMEKEIQDKIDENFKK
jgi:hypothetical protein